MMKQWYFLLVVFCCGLVVGCREADPVATPTPFASVTAVAAVDTTGKQPQPVTLAELETNPEAYQGMDLQVSGRFHRLPRIVCQGDANRPPATWVLRGDGTLVRAGGLATLRDAIPDQLTIAVVGRWHFWRGPVGCGKRSVVQEIWYLQAKRVLSPQPVSQATVTPATVPEDSAIAQLAPTATPGEGQPPGPAEATATPSTPETGEPTTIPSATPGDGQPVTATPSATMPPTTANPTPTPVMTSSPTVTATAGGEEQGTPQPTATSGAGTATPTAGATGAATATSLPTATSSSGSNPTATPIIGTGPTATATAAATVVVNRGSIASEELLNGRLQASQIHSWTFEIDAADAVTVSAISEANLVLSVLDASGTVLVQQDTIAAGRVEQLVDFGLDTAGTYTLRLHTINYSAADYGMLLLLSDGFNFVLRGLINYGQQRTDNLAEESDHFWHFSGQADEEITIRVSPGNNEGDLFMELYGVDGSLISDFIDSTGAGEEEELIFTLPETGLYGVRVGEFDFQETPYSISLTLN